MRKAKTSRVGANPVNMMPQANSAPRKSNGHLFWLDWLRFIAAFLVVAVHSRGNTWVEWGRLAEVSQTKVAAVFFALTRAGTECVLVFFVLSGFLVGGKVLQRLEQGCFSLREYAIDRVSRIWVPLVPALAWSAVVGYWVGKPVSWTGFGGNILGLQCVFFRSFADNIPLWSLAYEIWFYVLAGSCAAWAVSGIRGRVAATSVIVVVMAIFTQLNTVFLFVWLIGAATHFLCSKPRMPWLAGAGGVLTLAGLVFSQLNSATVSVNTAKWTTIVPTPAISILLLACGIALVLPFLTQVRPSTRAIKGLNDLGGRLAAFSYTLYLTHYPMLFVWEHYLPDKCVMIDGSALKLYFLRIASCVLLAWLMYLPFEKQTANLRRWLRKTLAVKTTA